MIGGWKLLEERHHLRATKVDAQDRPFLLINAMQREHGLGRVDAYAPILGHGRLRIWLLAAPILALDAVGPSTPTILDKSCGDPVKG